MEIISNLIEAHIFRKNQDRMEFLMLRRAPGEIYAGIWQMVTGKIRKDEQAYKTAMREIKEETNLDINRLWVAPNINSFYSYQKEYISLVPVFAAEVSPELGVKISAEHDKYKWVSQEEAKELLAWKGQRDSVDIIVEYFSEEQSNLKFIEIPLWENH